MKMKTLYNPSKQNIIDYNIEEAEFDKDGEPIIDSETMRPKWTGKTLQWSIRADETAKFPAYVADYLMKIYGFLVEKKEEKEEAEKAEGRESGNFVCKHCGKKFATKKNLGLHLGAKHFDLL